MIPSIRLGVDCFLIPTTPTTHEPMGVVTNIMFAADENQTLSFLLCRMGRKEGRGRRNPSSTTRRPVNGDAIQTGVVGGTVEIEGVGEKKQGGRGERERV